MHSELLVLAVTPKLPGCNSDSCQASPFVNRRVGMTPAKRANTTSQDADRRPDPTPIHNHGVDTIVPIFEKRETGTGRVWTYVTDDRDVWLRNVRFRERRRHSEWQGMGR